MKRAIPPILPQTFESMVSPWLSGIRKKDIVTVMSYPASDRQRRFLNLLDNAVLQARYLGDPKAYVWITIDFRVDPIDDVPDLEATILRRLAELVETVKKTGGFEEKIRAFETRFGKKVIIAAFGCEKLIQSQRTNILIWFTVMCRIDIVRMLLFFETNLFSKPSLAVLKNVPAFQPRISVLSLYGRGDTEQFMTYMSHKWSMRVTPVMREGIIRPCGGMFLLVKEALWYLRDHPKASLSDVLSHMEMRFNLESLWQGFSEDEQRVFDALIKGEDIDQVAYAPTIEYLLVIGFIKKTQRTYKPAVPLLASYRKTRIMTNVHLTIGDGDTLLLNDTPIGAHFSRRQRRVLVYLLYHKNEMVGRDTLASCLWGEQIHAKYSDWAIDSLISRLRQRLNQLGVDGSYLETKKGKGFLLRTL